MHPPFPSLGASFLSHTEVHPSMCALIFIPSHWNSVPSYVSAYSGHTSASSTLRNYSRKAQDLLQSYTQETFLRMILFHPSMAWHGMAWALLTTPHPWLPFLLLPWWLLVGTSSSIPCSSIDCLRVPS